MKNELIMTRPASWWGSAWREALPSGNGTIGAAVYGSVQNERILLNHGGLWRGVKTPPLPDVSGSLPTVRALLESGRATEADRVYPNVLKEKGYDPRIGAPLPLGDLKITMPVFKGFKNYRRILNMENGEVSVFWDDAEFSFGRKLFVSRTDDLVAMEIHSEGGPLQVDVSLDLHNPADARLCYHGEVPLPEKVTVQTEGEFIFYAAANEDGTDFGAVAQIRKTGRRALVLVKVFIEDERQVAWCRLKSQLQGISEDYNALLLRHETVHRELYHRVQLDLGSSEDDHQLSNEELLMKAYQGEAPLALIEKMWAYGRYLLISASQNGGLPCHLTGLWSGEYRGVWAFHMANVNLQMIHWQALPGAIPETMLPFFDYFDRRMDDFRENARKLFGCRGIFIPSVTTPSSGLLKTIMPHIIYWTGAAAWIAQHYYDYYLFTGDEIFLKKRALPFLREAALFYADFFTLDKNGFLHSAPSISPENNPAEYWNGDSMSCVMETTANATMDFALAKELLSHLIEAASQTGMYGDEVEGWRTMLRQIPPYQINEDGAIREWMSPYFTDNYHHRHLAHTYPIFPGFEVDRTSDPVLFQAFETAVHKRLEIGLCEQTGWSLAYMAHIFARMNDGDHAAECLDLLARSCLMNNLYTTHNDWRNMGIGVNMEWAPYQIDANMGWTSAVQEMLLFSVPGRIELLPALPAKWKKGSVTGLRARDGITVSIEWDQGDIRGTLVSSKDQLLEVGFPGGEKQTLQLEAKKICSMAKTSGSNVHN